jgi:sec-independent protein translocase protein TatA
MFTLPLFLNLGGGEVFVIVLVVVMLFGSKQIPEIARGLGKGMREVKDAMNGVETEIRREITKVEKDVQSATKLEDQKSE